MRALTRLFAIPMLALAGVAAAVAAPVKYQAGEDYQVIFPPQPTVAESEGQVEVAEIFWYGCPHCFAFEPVLQPWVDQLPESVNFVRVPAAFGPVWETHARAFYAAQVLGVEDKLHQDLFKAIHEEGKPLDSEDALAGFFADHGVAEDEFRDAYNSFTVQTRIDQAMKLLRGYGITSVPTLVIDGRYWVNPGLTDGFEGMIDVTEYLIEKARTEGQ